MILYSHIKFTIFLQVFSVQAVEGAWIVFAPFLPCLVWALAIRSQWLRTRDGTDSRNGIVAKEGSDTKTKAD